MSIRHVPEPCGPIVVESCACCFQKHDPVQTFSDARGAYFICPRTVERVNLISLGPAPVIPPKPSPPWYVRLAERLRGKRV